MSPETASGWDRCYRDGLTPWDTGSPSEELRRVLEEERLPPCRALELGCGTGTNAVHLARLGFAVTAIDVSLRALELARHRADAEGVAVDFLLGDLGSSVLGCGPFDFVFDRGCYTAVRLSGLTGYLANLRRLTRPGSRFLLLAASAAEVSRGGPARVHEEEIRADFQQLFAIETIRPFRSRSTAHPEGVLAWSCRLTRREPAGASS